MKGRTYVAALAVTTLVLLPASSGLAASACQRGATFAQQPRERPLADPRTYQPVNGTGGFSVFGANTLDRFGFSVGLGYMGENAVCQETDGDFDLNSVRPSLRRWE